MKLIILDRDGVINYESTEYIKTVDEWLPIPGSIEAIARLSKAGFTVAVATSQAGIGRGMFTEETLQKMHDKMNQLVVSHGGNIDKIVFCPHHPDEHCACRKPKPGLLKQLAAHYQCSLKTVPYIGDSLRDIQAITAVEGRPILVLTGNGKKAERYKAQYPGLEIYDNLAKAVDALLQEGHV